MPRQHITQNNQTVVVNNGQQKGPGGCAIVILFFFAILIGFWPFVYIHGPAGVIIGIAWLGLLAYALYAGIKRAAKVKQEKALAAEKKEHADAIQEDADELMHAVNTAYAEGKITREEWLQKKAELT
jgi:hypothetical protein